MLGLLGQAATPPVAGESFWILYDRLRPAILTGFLTASGFLFAMKTFIVVMMKRDVYDSEAYGALIAELRTIDKGKRYYGPLQNLRRLLFCAILCCLSTSLLDITLGLVHHWLIAAICISAAVLSIALVMASVVLVNRNVCAWLTAEEKKKTPNLADTKRP